MAWTFHRPRASQGVLSVGIVGAALGAMALPPVGAAWTQVVAAVPEWVLILVAPTVLHHGLYWAVSAFFHRVDTTDRPAWIAKHRIQDGKPWRPPLRRFLRNLAGNQLFFAPLMMLVIWGGLRLRGWAPTAALPGPLTVLWQLGVLGLFSEACFYASHRLLHSKPLMRRFHKVQHEFRAPAAHDWHHHKVVENFGTAGILDRVLGTDRVYRSMEDGERR